MLNRVSKHFALPRPKCHFLIASGRLIGAVEQLRQFTSIMGFVSKKLTLIISIFKLQICFYLDSVSAVLFDIEVLSILHASWSAFFLNRFFSYFSEAHNTAAHADFVVADQQSYIISTVNLKCILA